MAMSRLPKYGEVYRAKHGANTVVVRGVFQQRKGDSYHARVLKGAGKESDERKRGSVVWTENFYFTGGDSKKLLAKAVAAAEGASGPKFPQHVITSVKKFKGVQPRRWVKFQLTAHNRYSEAEAEEILQKYYDGNPRDRTSNPFTIGKKDKAVIRAFTEKESSDGHKLSTDGRRLDGLWVGGKGIAQWKGGKIVFTDLGSKAAQTVQRAVKKEAPANWLGGWSNPGSKSKATKKVAKATTAKTTEKTKDIRRRLRSALR